jgi:hypothetical protein
MQQPGHQALVPTKHKFLVQTAIWYDLANDGKANKEMTDMIQELQPGMTRKQANQSFHCTIHPKFVVTRGSHQAKRSESTSNND